MLSPLAMDDLWSRIQQQNAEVHREWEEREKRLQHMAERAEREARLREHEAYAASEASAATNARQLAPRPQGGDMRFATLTHGNMREQQLEQERVARLEQSLQRGAEQQANTRSGGVARKLQHAQTNPPEKENRGKIKLLPPRTAASSVAPSTRGGAAPSIAGSVTPSERLRRPVHFSHQMVKEHTGQMDTFLNPVDGIRGQMRRAGIEPKNHQKEQRQLLQDMAAAKQQAAHEQDVAAERAARLREQLKEKALTQPFADGEPATRGASAGRRSVRPAPTGQTPPPPAPRPHEPGHVPAYLQRRKAEWSAQAQEEAARAAAEAECPPGLRLVGPEEKSRILEKLAEERAKATLELRQLPFVVKTNATQQKKDRLEARLEEIEGAEQAYMKEKVFVPADM